MLQRTRVVAALEARRDAFRGYELRHSQEVQRYEEALRWLIERGQPEIEEALAAIARCGARPTRERHAGRHVVLPFAPRWANHAEARAWAMGIIEGVTTLSVDGSQITPSHDFSIPVGAVQVGWFENPHQHAAQYAKDVSFEVLPPDEFDEHENDDEPGGGQPFPNTQVNARRFELECEVLSRGMERLAGRQPVPVCFLDGSLIISFAAQMRPALRSRYLRAVKNALATSERTRVPLVGYVDNSRATDMVNMLARLRHYDSAPRISDGALLRRTMQWGQRSEAWICDRDDRLFREGASDQGYYYDQVLFLYLKTGAENTPVRIELPRWVLDAGLLDRVVDVVRAECVVGTGYPYAVETADAVAVLTMQDREQFYRVFQEFMQDLNLPLRYARKAYSKRGRR
jgi:hypothetical protein